MTILLLIAPLSLLAYLAWRWPDKAVALLVFLIPSYLLRTNIWLIPTNFFELGVAVLCAVAVLSPVLRRQLLGGVVSLHARSHLLFLLLFVIAAIISTIISPVPRVSLGILKSWIIIPIVFAFLASVFGKKKEVISALIWSGVIASLLAFPQIGRLPRLQSIYDAPNSLALWLAPILAMALWLWLSGKKIYFFLAMPMAAALIGTQSVMGVVSVGIALAVGAVIARPSLRAHLLLARAGRGNPGVHGAMSIIFALMLISGAFLFWSGKINYLTRPLFDRNYTNSISVRMQLWSVSVDLIKEHPMLGVGLGQFEPAYQKKLHERFIAYENAARSFGGRKSKPPIPEFVFRDPHNWILSFWLNAGLLGLVSFAGINFVTIKKLFSSPSSGMELLLALLVIIVFGLTDTIYWKNDLAATACLLIALASPSWGRLFKLL